MLNKVGQRSNANFCSSAEEPWKTKAGIRQDVYDELKGSAFAQYLSLLKRWMKNGFQRAGLPFPLPPVLEQRRIAAILDELMALCDQFKSA